MKEFYLLYIIEKTIAVYIIKKEIMIIPPDIKLLILRNQIINPRKTIKILILTKLKSFLNKLILNLIRLRLQRKNVPLIHHRWFKIC